MRLPAVAIVAVIGGGILLGLEPLRAFRPAHSSLSVFVGRGGYFPFDSWICSGVPGLRRRFRLPCGLDLVFLAGRFLQNIFCRNCDGADSTEDSSTEAEATVLDVGQGDSILVVSQNGRGVPGISWTRRALGDGTRGGSSFEVFVVAGISANGCCHLRTRRRYPSFRRPKKVLLGVPARNFSSGYTKAGTDFSDGPGWRGASVDGWGEFAGSCFEACPGLAAVSAKTQPPEENQPGEQQGKTE